MWKPEVRGYICGGSVPFSTGRSGCRQVNYTPVFYRLIDLHVGAERSSHCACSDLRAGADEYKEFGGVGAAAVNRTTRTRFDRVQVRLESGPVSIRHLDLNEAEPAEPGAEPGAELGPNRFGRIRDVWRRWVNCGSFDLGNFKELLFLNQNRSARFGKVLRVSVPVGPVGPADRTRPDNNPMKRCSLIWITVKVRR